MNSWGGGVAGLLIVVVLAGCAPSMIASTTGPVVQPAVETVEVVAVVDGDTIDVATEDGAARVRLIGIDTPEIGRGEEASECYAEEARTFLDELLHGKEVHLGSDPTQADIDKYGRLLRHVFIGGESAAEMVIAAGAGYEYTYSTAYAGQSEYRAAEDLASATGVGLWAACG